MNLLTNNAWIKNLEIKTIQKSFLQDFVNNVFLQNKPPVDANTLDADSQDLLRQLELARREMEIADLNYEFANEDDLVDYYIYQMKAAEIKYQYLLKQARDKGIRSENADLLHIWQRKSKVAD